MKRTPLPPRSRAIKRSAIKKKNRSASEFKRIYGSKKRVEWVKSLPCSACQITGFSENAHIETGGTGRKADARFIVPLCGMRKVQAHFYYGDLYAGCHRSFDEHPKEFFARFPNLDMQAVAGEVEKQWQLENQK